MGRARHRFVSPAAVRGGRGGATTLRQGSGGAVRTQGIVAAAVLGAVNEARRRGAPQEAGEDGRKNTDIGTLGNLCVDVVLSVPQLQPEPRE
jgi:hypothetical protein